MADDVAPARLDDIPSPTARSMVNHRRLVEWIVQQGGSFHEDLVIAYEPNRGYHALVGPGKHIPKSTRIATCPMEATLCVLNPLDVQPFACHGVRFPQTFLDRYATVPELLQTFFLMEHYLQGDRSWWARYIATLPTPDDLQELYFESPEDCAWIRGTNLEAAQELQLQTWQVNFREGLEHLKSRGWENALNGKLTWDLFRWATTIFGTRSFTSQVLSDTTPADLARPLGRGDPSHQLLSKLFSDRFAVILPLLDILNHKPAAQIEWQARYSYVGLEVLEDYGEGEELFNNYGPRDNESLLLSYGFVLPSNPFDHVAVSIRVPPGSPLADARTWPVDSRSNEHYNCYIFGPSHPIVTDNTHLERAFFSYDLLDSISVLTANDRELNIMYDRQRSLMSASLPRNFTDFRNLLGTVSQLLQDCRARLNRLHHSDPVPPGSHMSPRNQKQRYAQMYREGQAAILQHAIAICTFVLFHSSTNLDPDAIVSTMQSHVPHFHSPHIRAVSGRLTCVTAPNELLTVDDVIRSVPPPLKGPLETTIQEVTRAHDQSRAHPTLHSDVIKSGFAVAFSVLGQEYLQGRVLGNARLTHWFTDLMQWYPPSDENWSYVPSPGPWAPGEEPPAALMSLLSVISSLPEAAANPWLQPRMICWGWNVLEEEGVRVPLELERYCDGIVEAGIEDGAIGFMVYCKGY